MNSLSDPTSKILLAVWAGATLALVLIAWVRQKDGRGPNDKDLEASRLVYGFWLIIGSLVLTLAVVVIVTTSLRPATINTTDMLAVITSVTGVIGTLIAAFFGVQAAGAGRSQALSALTQIHSQATSAEPTYKLDPPYGPHAGGTRVSVTGNAFSSSNALNFDSTPAGSFEFVNDGLVRGNAPPSPGGKDSVDVALIFPGAGTLNRKLGTFYYYTIDPASGPAGQTIKIKGAGLQTAKAARFGSGEPVLATHVNGSLEVTVPSKPANLPPSGEVEVSVIYPVDTPTNASPVGKFKYVDGAPSAAATPATEDDDAESLDACGLGVVDITPDDALPAATGGVEN